MIQNDQKRPRYESLVAVAVFCGLQQPARRVNVFAIDMIEVLSGMAWHGMVAGGGGPKGAHAGKN